MARKTTLGSSAAMVETPLMSSSLPASGYLRLYQIIGRPARNDRPAIVPIIPVSRSTWWSGVKSGRYPTPTRTLGKRITAWRVEDIRQLLEGQ